MPNSKTGSEGENLSRIRDILFGEDLQSIESKLAITKKEYSEISDGLKKEFEERLNVIEKALEEKKLHSDQSLKKHIEDQSDTNKNIQQEIQTVDTYLKAEIEKLSGDLKDKTMEIHQKITNLEESLIETINNLKNDQEAKSEKIIANNVSKASMAELLIELAEKIKQ